ncbi:hypothetical protein CsatA_029618 [Cannabis sativa]
MMILMDPLNNEFSKSEEGTADYDNNKFSDTCYLSCIGNVTGFEDAGVEVKWANGITSKVAPYEIVRVDKHDGAASISVDEEDSVISTVVDVGCKKHLWETASFSLPQAAIGFFTNVAASLLGTLDSNLDPDSTPLVQVPEVQSESKMSNAKEVMEGNDLCSESELVTELGQKKLVKEGSSRMEHTREKSPWEVKGDCYVVRSGDFEVFATQNAPHPNVQNTSA